MLRNELLPHQGVHANRTLWTIPVPSYAIHVMVLHQNFIQTTYYLYRNISDSSDFTIEGITMGDTNKSLITFSELWHPICEKSACLLTQKTRNCFPHASELQPNNFIIFHFHMVQYWWVTILKKHSASTSVMLSLPIQHILKAFLSLFLTNLTLSQYYLTFIDPFSK